MRVKHMKRQRAFLCSTLAVTCVLFYTILAFHSTLINSPNVCTPVLREPLVVEFYGSESEESEETTIVTEIESVVVDNDEISRSSEHLQQNETAQENSINLWDISTSTHNNQTSSTKSVMQLMETVSSVLSSIIASSDTRDEHAYTKEEALFLQSVFIKQEMHNYSILEGVSNLPTGEEPMHNIIFTTWRSGSTFLGEVTASHPATFYHYEPLLHFNISQVRANPLEDEALRVLKGLLKCDYSELDQYLEYGKSHHYLHEHNQRLWKFCFRNRRLCSDKNFLHRFCRLFPFQIMKTVRMRFRYAENFIGDANLNARILLLIRDPRGVMQSRKHRDWCPGNPDCEDPALLCQDMVDDYNAAVRLREIYPDRIMFVRYEDVSTNPHSGIQKVMEFFRLCHHHPNVQEFIRTHTVLSVGDVSSTYRDSKKTPFYWKNYFSQNENHAELVHIQDVCSEAMRLWGYANFEPDRDGKDFNPMLSPPWEDMVIMQDV